MQLPRPDSTWSRVNGFGVYVAARLTAADRLTQAESARRYTTDVKITARRAEDLSEETIMARANRDASDDRWDSRVQGIRLTLASASLDAVHQKPYTDVFFETTRYYTESPLAEQSARMGEFITRLDTYLPADHPLRAELPALKAYREEWDAAVRAVQEAEIAEDLAWGQLDTAEAIWRTQMDILYSELRAEEGRKAADRYFP